MELQTVLIRSAPTDIRGRSVALVDPAQPVKIEGGPNRKQIAISNPATANSIMVYDRQGGQIINQIFPQTTWTLETNADIYIAPSGAANFNAYVAQTFYT